MIEDKMINNLIDPVTGMPAQANRAGVPARSVNDLQAINTIQDPGMQSAQQAAAYSKFNNIAQMIPPAPATKTEKVYQADAEKAKYKDSYGTQTSYKRKTKDKTVSADLTTGKGNTLPAFEISVKKSPSTKKEDEPKASVKAMEVNQVSKGRTEVQEEGNKDVKQRTARLGGSF